MRLDHIAIICSDRDASVRFYNSLGFNVLREIYRADKDDILIKMSDGECELELFAKKNCPDRLTYPEAYGLRHIAFRCSDLDDTVSKLKEKGYTTERIRRDSDTGERMTFVIDPDGTPVELREEE